MGVGGGWEGWGQQVGEPASRCWKRKWVVGMPWVKGTALHPHSLLSPHPWGDERGTMPSIPGPQQCRFDAFLGPRESHACAGGGLLGHPGSPAPCQDSPQSAGSPSPLLLGAQFLCLESGGVVRTGPAPRGARRTCPQSASKRRSAASSLSPAEGEGPGPWPWATWSPCGRGVARPQPGGAEGGAAWPWLRKSRAASAPAAWGLRPLPGPPPCPPQPSGPGPDGSRQPQPGSDEKARAAAATVFSGRGRTGSGGPRGGPAHTCHRHTSARLSQDPQAGLRPIWDLAETSERLAHPCPGVHLPRSGSSSPSLHLPSPRLTP